MGGDWSLGWGLGWGKASTLKNQHCNKTLILYVRNTTYRLRLGGGLGFRVGTGVGEGFIAVAKHLLQCSSNITPGTGPRQLIGRNLHGKGS